MNYVYFLIGSNKGDRMIYLEEASRKIIQQIGLILKSSSIYETEPWGFENDSQFLNQCIKVETLLQPYDILKSIKGIEARYDRRKNSGFYENRNMDIDILFYNDIILHEEDLKIPHPLLHKRKFALVPLVEIEPGLIHPVLNKTVSELLSECSDNKIVEFYG